jgi:hypothetical protein
MKPGQTTGRQLSLLYPQSGIRGYSRQDYLDATRRLLESFIDLNSLMIERFSADERKRIGIHSCPGADRHSSHSVLLPSAGKPRS